MTFDTPSRWRDALLPFVHHRRGAVAVEAAFAIAFLIISLAAVVDFGGYIRTGIELKQAIRAGAQYALDLGAIGQADYNDATAIQAKIEPVIKSAAKLTNMTITNVSTTCVCPNGSTGSQYCTGDSSFTQCSNNRPGARFLAITATSTYDPLFTFIPWFQDNMQVAQSLELRVQ